MTTVVEKNEDLQEGSPVGSKCRVEAWRFLPLAFEGERMLGLEYLERHLFAPGRPLIAEKPAVPS